MNQKCQELVGTVMALNMRKAETSAPRLNKWCSLMVAQVDAATGMKNNVQQFRLQHPESQAVVQQQIQNQDRARKIRKEKATALALLTPQPSPLTHMVMSNILKIDNTKAYLGYGPPLPTLTAATPLLSICGPQQQAAPIQQDTQLALPAPEQHLLLTATPANATTTPPAPSTADSSATPPPLEAKPKPPAKRTYTRKPATQRLKDSAKKAAPRGRGRGK